ncbi:hypothetical protein P280DRAFT_474044 [Massarina eburnea CBS 473.64]|uniref:Uncharacterized protein n=1 Tax=Massarina eburnea CBS 473.64 TaxID=1395130 RepID=A0A6A6RM18_9PLEO|nr:hypothetical protein P280DRAFT_474044 [Massarina eburnea CBS 473.64]
MTTLIDLPNELLLSITSHFTTGNEIDVTTLLSLCRTSRLLRYIAQPALYTCVRISEPEDDPLRPLKIFLKTLLQRPALAKVNRELDIVNDRELGHDRPALREDECFMEISALIGGYSSEINPDLCFFPLAVEVLARLPNLQHLRLTCEIAHPGYLLGQLHHLRASGTILSELKTFRLDKQYEEGLINIQDYIPFLRYPSFEEFISEGNNHPQFGQSHTHNSISHSEVTLYWCIIDEPITKLLLDTCDALREFTFVVADEEVIIDDGDTGHLPLVCPRQLLTALLESHCQTLKVLILDFRHRYNFDYQDLEDEIYNHPDYTPEINPYTYPSFHGFERLTNMLIEFERLVEVRHLPSSLRVLTLKYCHFENMEKEYLDDLIRLKETWCPEIISVTVTGSERTNDGIMTLYEHARTLNAPVHATEDGRVLTFLGTGRHLQIQSHLPLFWDDSELVDLELA